MRYFQVALVVLLFVGHACATAPPQTVPIPPPPIVPPTPPPTIAPGGGPIPPSPPPATPAPPALALAVIGAATVGVARLLQRKR